MDFLTQEQGQTVHYFIHAQDGLVRSCSRAGSWQPRERILCGAKDGFGLFCENEQVHIVTATKQNELIYLAGSGGDFRKFILASFGAEYQIHKICIYPVRGRLNMLYSVQNGENITLMHCILGNNAKPNTVSRMQSKDFFVSGMRVYFCTPGEAAGFCELSDEKPDFFIRMFEKSGVPYVSGGHIAYISAAGVYFDSRRICTDENAHGVIITEADARLFAAWKSGDYVKYLPADSTSGNPYCIINPSRTAKLYGVWRDGELIYFYGSNSDSELTTYINPHPFGVSALGNTDVLRMRLEAMKSEIAELKQKLAKYGQ